MASLKIQNKSIYSSGMTGCGFMLDEMTRMLPLLLADNSDELLKQEIEDNNVLLIATKSSRRRAIPEFKRRFKSMGKDFWERYLELSPKMQSLAMFFVLLKAYRIYFDFQVETVRNKWNSFNQTISKNDILSAISDIACKDEFVDSWTEETRDRVASAFLSVLRKIGMIDGKENKLQELDYSDCELTFFVRIGEPWFLDAMLLPPYRIDNIKSLIS